MPTDFTREGLEGLGFVGFVPVRALRDNGARMRAIPRDKGGVYLAFRDSVGPPRFRRANPAGTWRGDPTLPIGELWRRWVDGSPIVYVGKADLTPSTNLRKRISAYLRFGAGSNARHSGGYPTWQLSDSDRLLIAWLVVRPPKTPRREEIRLCAAHRVQFGALPFANSMRARS